MYLPASHSIFVSVRLSVCLLFVVMRLLVCQSVHDCCLQDPKSVNRSVTPWVVAHGHRPAYATVVTTASVTQAQHQRNAFEDIFVQYGVSTFRLNQLT